MKVVAVSVPNETKSANQEAEIVNHVLNKIAVRITKPKEDEERVPIVSFAKAAPRYLAK